MKLYYSPGACSMASHIVLRETGADFTLEKVDIRAKVTAGGGDYWAVNSKGSVPALETDEGEVLTEGPAILQYVADRAGDTRLSPASGTMARARMQEMLNFVGSELHKAYSPLFNPALDEEGRAASRALAAKKLAWLERALSDGRDFLTGAEFTVADAYAFVVINWSRMVAVDLEAFPRVQAFMARVAARPSVVAAMKAEGLTA